MTFGKHEEGKSPPPLPPTPTLNKISIKVAGEYQMLDTVFHQGVNTLMAQGDSNFLIVAKVLRATVLEADAVLPSGEPPDGKPVTIEVIVRW